MAALISVKVSKRYQIAVPAIARQLLSIKSGDRLLVDNQDGIIDDFIEDRSTPINRPK